MLICLFYRTARLDGQELKIARLSIPPAAHFEKSPELIVTTVHAVVVDGANTLSGSWVQAGQFIEEVFSASPFLTLRYTLS